MKIGVTGYRGRLGAELVSRGLSPCLADITSPESVRGNTAEFDVIINCAAYTAVDGAESNYHQALKINSMGVRNLRNWFKGRIVHISTDYVFSGQTGPYDEKNQIRTPINCYGFSKLGGEIALQEPRTRGDVVVRTTGLYGGCSGRPDLASYAYERLQAGNEFRATSDMIANQTYIPHLVEALLILAKSDVDVPVLNLASHNLISRYEFVRLLAEVCGLDRDLVVPVKSTDVDGWVAKRPLHGGLKTKLARSYNLPIYTIMEGLNEWSKHK